MTSVEKVNAARSALARIPEKGVLGLGSGSTVAVFARMLGERFAEGIIDVSVVPSSYQAYNLAIQYGIPLTTLDIHPELDMTIDGADEVDRQLNLTKGGGGALFQEKIVAFASREMIVIVDESKLVEKLGSRFRVPIEVLPFAVGVVTRKIRTMGITPILREAKQKMGPVVTDNGNFIIDLEFPKPIDSPQELAVQLKMIPGVVETGLFVGMADEVHVGTSDGSYVILRHDVENKKT